jgi:hypothetical protein
VVLGRASGTRDEYGHCDISFGRHVKTEVFEPAARFLATGVFRLPRVAAAAELESEDFEPVHASPAQ